MTCITFDLFKQILKHNLGGLYAPIRSKNTKKTIPILKDISLGYLFSQTTLDDDINLKRIADLNFKVDFGLNSILVLSLVRL